MSPEASDMLMQHIVPAITATVPRTCRPVGSEDYAELVQDTILTAARMLDAAERAGKAVNPSSIVFYAIQTTRSGRRSQSSSGTDALGVRARFSAGSVPDQCRISACVHLQGLSVEGPFLGDGCGWSP